MVKKRRLKKSPRLTIKSIKAKNYSPAYEARLIRAVRSGKTSRQKARGHKKKEHVIRKERERASAGITSTELAGIRSFISRFNANGHKDIPDEETLVDFVRNRGYKDFIEYRKTWDSARRKYVSELSAGTWESRGMQYLNHLTGMAGITPQGDNMWLYYH